MADKVVVTLGCDPEFFLINRVNQSYVSSIGLIGGSKDKPLPIAAGEHLGLQVLEDNVTLEFNINPATTANALFSNVREAKAIINNTLLFPRNLQLAENINSAEFPDAQLANEQARVFGCDPDFDAYSQGKMRTPPTPSLLKNARCAGGHVHLGWDKSKCNVPDWAIVQMLDLCAGLWHYSLFGVGIRRQHYGLAGLYRPKPYGIEYRTPDNSWTNNGGNQFLSNLANTVAAIVTNQGKARDWYDAVNWKEVGSCLSRSPWDGSLHRVVQAQYDNMVRDIIDIGNNAREGAEAKKRNIRAAFA